MQDLEGLISTGNWIQIFAIVLIFLGGILQISKFVIDKKIKKIKTEKEIIAKEEQEKKVAGLEAKIESQEEEVGVLNLTFREQQERTNELNETLKQRNDRLKELETRVRIIHSVEVHMFIDEKTTDRDIGELKSNMGISFAIAFFNEKNERFRFVTDGTFSNQQINKNTNRGTLKFRPENPSQVLGKNISFLESFEVLVYNFSESYQYFEFDKINKTHRITLHFYLNGTKVLDLRNIPHDNGKLSEGQLSLDLKNEFSKLEEKYQDKIDSES
ncbi:hypothetical protein [Flagellimonas sp. 2504JD4-2]